MSFDDFGQIHDGFGSCWDRCGDDCDLHIVRPGKAQCNEDGVNCPLVDHKRPPPEQETTT